MNIDAIEQHLQEVRERVKKQGSEKDLKNTASSFFEQSHKLKYSYNFSWLGRPIIQYPQDVIAFQEIAYQVKPDLIIETGIAHGGSLMLSASLLCMIDITEGIDPRQSGRKVVGVDIDIREHNRKEIDKHPLRFKMELIEGSSIEPNIIQQIRSLANGEKRVLICLDSNHTYDHVLEELDGYGDLTSIGSYCIVFDTIIEDLPDGSQKDRPWGIGNNPKTAVIDWLKRHPEFILDEHIDNKLLISAAPSGYLRRIK